MPSLSPIDNILDRLSDARRSPNGGWNARCPAHDDRHASLTIRAGRDGTALIRCHAGCDTAAVVAALGLKFADLYPDRPARSAARRKSRAAPPAPPNPDGLNSALAALFAETN